MAIASRFCWPKLRVSGGRSRMPSTSARPVRRSASMREGIGIARSTARGCAGPKRSSSRTVRAKSIWLGLWKTYPMLRASSAIGRPRVSVPSTRTAPASGSTRLIAVRNSVVLPEPFGPSTATASPRAEVGAHAAEDVPFAERHVDRRRTPSRDGPGSSSRRGSSPARRRSPVPRAGEDDLERKLDGVGSAPRGIPSPVRGTSHVRRPSPAPGPDAAASASSTRCSTMTTACPASARPRSRPSR